MPRSITRFISVCALTLATVAPVHAAGDAHSTWLLWLDADQRASVLDVLEEADDALQTLGSAPHAALIADVEMRRDTALAALGAPVLDPGHTTEEADPCLAAAMEAEAAHQLLLVQREAAERALLRLGEEHADLLDALDRTQGALDVVADGRAAEGLRRTALSTNAHLQAFALVNVPESDGAYRVGRLAMARLHAAEEAREACMGELPVAVR